MKVASVAEMRAMDRHAAEKLSIREDILMEQAGMAAYCVLSREAAVEGLRCVIMCGPGNNGGDGFVVARLLHANGARVKVFLAGAEGKFKGAAKSNLDIIKKLPIEIDRIESAAAVRNEIMHSQVLVDALLGTGLDREVTGLFGDLIRLMNESGKKILSLDIPSGINGDTGAVMGAAVRADYTVTFGLPKIGNMLYPGYGHCGKLHLTHISFPPSLHDDGKLKIQLNGHIPLPLRPPDAHKGMMGKALFIAGSASYFGAPYFSALSFLKAGGGYAYLATPRSMAPVIAQKGSEIVFLPQDETPAGSISLKNKKQLLALADNMDMVVIGPGLSLEDETCRLVRELAGAIKKPLLIDGDGISALSNNLKVIRQRQAPTVLTPHLGEMTRLAKQDITVVESHKIPVLQKTADELGAILVMKGAHSLIGAPDGQVFINLSGNPGMATAGSGDVLTGAIAAMFGLGLPLEEAVRKGVFIHGFAGDLAAADRGEDGITASDVLEYLPLALKHDREGIKEPFKGRYEIPLV
jgi:ADP-dependent NAD(P)H-hydrate dehydratase / NAD(P)H-hydrate epimerase